MVVAVLATATSCRGHHDGTLAHLHLSQNLRPTPSTCTNSLVAVAYCVRQRFITDHDPDQTIIFMNKVHGLDGGTWI
jgi:hypothetical protein